MQYTLSLNLINPIDYCLAQDKTDPVGTAISNTLDNKTGSHFSPGTAISNLTDNNTEILFSPGTAISNIPSSNSEVL
jgi:hypothetical protein